MPKRTTKRKPGHVGLLQIKRTADGRQLAVRLVGASLGCSASMVLDQLDVELEPAAALVLSMPRLPLSITHNETGRAVFDTTPEELRLELEQKKRAD